MRLNLYCVSRKFRRFTASLIKNNFSRLYLMLFMIKSIKLFRCHFCLGNLVWFYISWNAFCFQRFTHLLPSQLKCLILGPQSGNRISIMSRANFESWIMYRISVIINVRKMQNSSILSTDCVITCSYWIMRHLS